MMKRAPRIPVIRLLLFSIIALSIFSCIAQKNLEYIQDQVDVSTTYPLSSYDQNLIKPNDELYISVSSFDDLNFNYFQSTTQTGYSQGGTEMGLSLISYAVKEDGTVYYPIIGDIKFSGLSLKQATELLTEKLNPYFDQPTVVIRFAYKKVTVLGEVNNPGYYTYSKEKLSVFDALGLAGDLTIHGNRSKIYIIRNSNNQEVQKIKVDITNDSIFTSDYYFLKADDILYVAPRSTVKWATVPSQLSIVFSAITSAILILNYFSTR